MKKLLLALLTIAGLAVVPGCRNRDCCNPCETYDCGGPCERYEEGCSDGTCSVEHHYSEPSCNDGSCNMGSCPVKEYYDVNMGETMRIKEPKKAPIKKASTQPAAMKAQAPAAAPAPAKPMATQPMSQEM